MQSPSLRDAISTWHVRAGVNASGKGHLPPFFSRIDHIATDCYLQLLIVQIPPLRCYIGCPTEKVEVYKTNSSRWF